MFIKAVVYTENGVRHIDRVLPMHDGFWKLRLTVNLFTTA
jgi:hypothetical protein